MGEHLKRKKVKQFEHLAGEDLKRSLGTPTLESISPERVLKEVRFEGSAAVLPEAVGADALIHFTDDRCELVYGNRVVGVPVDSSHLELSGGVERWLTGRIEDACPLTNIYSVAVEMEL